MIELLVIFSTVVVLVAWAAMSDLRHARRLDRVAMRLDEMEDKLAWLAPPVPKMKPTRRKK